MATTPPKKRSKKTVVQPETKAQALRMSRFNSLSLKSRIGVIIILTSLLLGAVYLSLTNGAGISFGAPDSTLGLTFDDNWRQPQADGSYSVSSTESKARLRLRANRKIDAWRLLNSDYYSGACGENAFIKDNNTNALRADRTQILSRLIRRGQYVDYISETRIMMRVGAIVLRRSIIRSAITINIKKTMMPIRFGII